MKKVKKLITIAKCIEKEAKKIETTIPPKAKKEYQETKKILETSFIHEETDFTLTIGNLNAYMG